MRWPIFVQEFPGSAPRWVPWVFGALLTGIALWLASHVILMLFSAVLFAVFLSGLSHWTSDKLHLSQNGALAAAVLFLVGASIGLAWMLVPQVAQQVDQLVPLVPQTFQSFTQVLQRYEWGVWLVEQASDGINGDSGMLSSGVGLVGSVFSSTVAVIVNSALILIIGLYLAAEAGSYRRGFLTLVPPAKRDRAAEVLRAGGKALRGWLLGKLCSMASLGVLSFIGLTLLDVRLALTMAVLTALLAFIPNLGAILSVIPPVLLALADDPWKALYVLIFYIVLQNVEGMLITPMIQRQTASLPPALLMTTQLFMAAFFGAFGLLLAEPLCALGLVLVKMLYVEDTLNEPVSAVAAGSDGPAASVAQC